jgi:hypothetical protein
VSEFKATSTDIISHLSPIEPLQPQLSREKPQKVSNGWQKLLVSAEKVNRLSEQLEAALFELKIVASEIKGDRNAQPMANKLFNHRLIAIPCIHYKRPGLIVVTTRKLDLFQQEREALQVAQMLRRRTKRRLKRPIPSTLSKPSKLKGQTHGFVRHLFLTWQNLKVAIGQKPASCARSTTVNKTNAISY